MPLAPGTRFGEYEIVCLLGAGSMGEVYQASDRQLRRTVALKILAEGSADDADRLGRFAREAQVLAALNHPNIAAIYGLAESDRGSPGGSALVMEFVDGPTLADVIARGPVAPGEAIRIAKQITDALEAAHDQGIVHRDLKPANIKVRLDGAVKVLDFGLAKALDPFAATAAGAPVSEVPTITSPPQTLRGVILGTAAYMSPEQAAGKPVDKRGDLWALGVVLFEMLTGRRPFEGGDFAHVLAAVLKSEPEWARLPADTPTAVRRVLHRCLEKDRRRRMADAADVRLELEDALTPSAEAPAAARRPTRWLFGSVVAAAAVSSLATALAMWTLARPVPRRPEAIVRFLIQPPSTEPLNLATIWRSIAISPDGTRLAYFVGDSGSGGQLMVRGLDDLQARPVAGASEVRDPFFSPDGQWIAFMSSNGLKKISIGGGMPVSIVDDALLSVRGASWGDNGDVVFATSDPAKGLFRVPASGGSAVPLTTPDAAQHEGGHVFPWSLPEGRGVLFTIRASGSTPVRVAVLDSRTGKVQELVRGASNASYVQSGHLVYESSGSIREAPFDLATLKVTDDSHPLAERVVMTVEGEANYSVSLDGVLAYVATRAAVPRSLVWVDRAGRETPIVGLPFRPYSTARLSPDEHKIAVAIADQDEDLWIWDVVRGGLSRFTNAPQRDDYPLWTPDGKSIVFSSSRTGEMRLYRQPVDGTGEAVRIESGLRPMATSMSKDGTHLIFHQNNEGTRWVLFEVALGAAATPRPLLSTPGQDQQLYGAISPDGRFVAYNSTEAGIHEVFIRPYPLTDTGRWQVSNMGGTRPMWSRDGRELFYVNQDSSAVMAATVQTTGVPIVGVPARVLDLSRYVAGGSRPYDVSADGRKFLVVRPETIIDRTGPATQIFLTLNLFGNRPGPGR